MYIPDEKIEEIRAATDLVDLVSDYVRLKKRGSNFVGLCPFHNEKTPSFNVNPGMGIFKCFGCGAGGDAFQFVIRSESLSFPEAARLLADRAGVPMPEETGETEVSNELEAIYHALRFAGRYFYRQLTQTPAGEPALRYLTERRGFTPKTIKRFGLGYAPDRWDGLLKAAEEQHIEAETLENAGLVIPRRDKSGHYDRYRGRVIFPILSHVGKVLGFGGRILEADSEQPKYINSPETRVYHKSRVLYGLHQGKQAIRKAEEVILVEGYTDVISLHQAGVENVVAASGTSLTSEQVTMLGRYAKRILLLNDADAAGTGASLRAVDTVLAEGLAVYAVTLPGGEDPDSYVQQEGADAFREYVGRARQDFVAFKYAEAERAGSLDTPEGQAEAMRDVVASIARMPDPLMQETYLRRASEVLRVPDIRLHQVLDELRRDDRRRARRSARREAAPPAPPTGPPAPPPHTDDDVPFEPAEEGAEAPMREPLPEEKTLVRLMLEHGTAMVEFVLGHMGLEEFTEGPSRAIAEKLMAMYEDGAVGKAPFLDGSLGPAVQSLASEVLVDLYEPSENWQRKNIEVPRFNADAFEAATSAMVLLKLDRVDEAIERQRGRIFKASQTGDDLRPLQEEMMALHGLRKQIEARAFLDWDPA